MAEANNKNYIHAVGRRKEAVARVRLYRDFPEGLKQGEILVNGKPIEEYFSIKTQKAGYESLFSIVPVSKYSITVKVSGGGREGQLEAMVLGISRALSKISEGNKKALRKSGMLTRDARVRQRRKVGMGGKSRRKRQSPKR